MASERISTRFVNGCFFAADLDQIKLALQKALEEGAKKDAIITRQGVQLNAKDAILSSNRSLITELNNKLKGNSVTGNVAK